ncbi:M16 family metallopeptidase [Anaeromyxobacter dehalogenans]|uniref:Peptidase M16-like protein n=1 Tax=Anaeromyxobacter dehalogenans (strain 2CP-C) TaxID=290397 RepID=Q2IEY6_ANADE|nr:pitrilysin family protein [Anaeromyxobacter dehalogenans]ABC83148.1 peptidase M16-like protein [Anaeromyxobacter dehalogenans 2CP-C]
MPMRTLASLTLVALAALAAPAAAAPAASAARLPEIPDLPYVKTVLPNGLTLIVHEDHKAPIVAVNVWYHVGSKNERPGKTGFAHLFEHLMFNGSEHFDDDWFKVLERVGASDLNGTTNNDRTNYFQNVPVSALDTVLWMESDRMGHLLGAITQARLDEQRGVVQNEKRQGENQPYGRVYDVMTPSLYPKAHPYSWTVIGSMEDLQAASLADVKEWFTSYYGASNAVLVIAGDVKPDEVRKKVEHYFGDVPPGEPIAKQQAWIAKRTGEQRQVMQDRVPQARAYLVWNTPEWGHPDDDLLTLAAGVLASGKTSRLYKRLVYDERIATDVSADPGTGEIGSTFFVEATAKPGGDLAKVERAVREEVARLVAQGPTAEELVRAKTGILAGFVRGVERIGGFGGVSDVLAESQVYGGTPDAYRTRLARIRSATAAQVREACRRWLSDGVYVLSVLPFPELQAAATGADRKVRPEPGPAPAPRFPAFTRHQLSNGLKVVVAERHAVPDVQLDLLVDAGYASDQHGAPGLAKLATAMLDEGTRSRSALEISDTLQRLGARLETGADLDTSLVSMAALRANLDASLALLADVVVNPVFPEADFERLKAQQLAALGQEAVQPVTAAFRILPRLLYGEGHAYSNPLTGSGTAATVGKLSRADAARWHATWVKPNNATLVVVGDTTAAEIVPKLERLLGGWKAGEVPKKNLAQVALPAGQRVFLLDRPGSIQSVVIAGQVAPPRANPEEIAQTAMNTVLGGAFTSRLNMNLREDKHWSYGARALLTDARGQRPFFALAPVQADKTKETVLEIRKELAGIRGAKPVTAEETAVAQGTLTLSLPGRWETSRAVARSIAQIVRFGFDDRYFDGFAHKVAALGPKDLADAARMLEPERVTWVIIGDRAKIEPGLREIGLGQIQLVDADGNVKPGAAAASDGAAPRPTERSSAGPHRAARVP